MVPGQRVTERENELTRELDAGGAESLVRKLREVDQQLFCGWKEFPGIHDVLDRLSVVAQAAAAKLGAVLAGSNESVVFVFTGCGTSGRIAWLCAVELNRLLTRLHPGAAPCFKYRISGGDEALIVSKELPEDDPHLGATDLADAVRGYAESFVFGITCGLSAPYVAGQIDAAMHMPSCTAVLIGFNPVELARDAPVEGWDKRCAAVFRELGRRADEGDPQCHVITPVVGPEAVTGSSRMKGGSMTKVILESIFLHALEFQRAGEIGEVASSFHLQDVVLKFERAYRDAYLDVAGLAQLTELAGASLRTGRAHLYYVGFGVGGLMSIIDASEMVDTYGTRVDEVQAFVYGGWQRCENNEGNMSDMGPLFHVSSEDFMTSVVKTLSVEDTVILVNASTDTYGEAVAEAVKAAPCRAGLLVVGDTQIDCLKDASGFDASATIHLSVDTHDIVAPFACSFALKLALNVISTGANVLRGAVYGNTMINLTVSNNKLMQRSAEIVSKITGCSIPDAHRALLRAIHGVDEVSATLQNQAASAHIALGASKANIVPTAALLATGMFGYAEATQKISDSSSPLRELIRVAVAKSKTSQ